MVLTLDRIARKTANRVGDRNRERLAEIRGYVEDTVTSITMLLKKGSVYQSSAVTVSSNEATLPNNCMTVLKIHDGNGVFYEVVDNDEYRNREQKASTMPTAQVFENVPSWTIRFLNFGTGLSTVNVDYLITSKNPSILPDYYEQLIIAGASKRYHLNRSPIDTYREHASVYKDMINEFKEFQQYNDSEELLMKGLALIESQDPENSFSGNIQSDFISPYGGNY